MTLIGKFLTVVNFLIGLGLLTWATTTFLLRPGYFDPLTDAEKAGTAPPPKVTPPINFEREKRDAEAYFRQANLASGAWGERSKVLGDLEVRRDERRQAFAQRLEWAQKGSKLKDPFSPGFFSEKDRDPGVIPKAAEEPLKGPDDQPLRGADTLDAQRTADLLALEELAKQVEAARLEYARLSGEIVRNEARLTAMTVIRDDVLAEAFYLAAVEVTVYETRETVFRRKRQLDRRLAELGAK